jgi:hypothetical protein
LRYLAEACAAHQLPLVDAEPGYQIGRGLNAPIEANAARTDAFGDRQGSIAIHQKIVIHHPDQLEPVARRQIAQFFADLFRFERIPLSPVHALVGAVAAVERAGQAAGVHGPAASTQPFIRVEIGDVIRLGRHLRQGPQLTPRIEDELPLFFLALFFVAHARDPLGRFAGFDVADHVEEGFLALADHDDVDVLGCQRLIRQE